MKNYLKTTIFLLVATTFSFCSSKKEITSKTPSEIEEVYFQKWIGGQEFSGSGVDFHLKFKDQLPQDTKLTKVYFQNQEASFEKENETTFTAKFYSKSNLIKVSDSIKTDLNKIENEAFPFSLNPTEAILEFNNKNKIVHLKIVNIKEKELLAYPSAGPRN